MNDSDSNLPVRASSESSVAFRAARQVSLRAALVSTPFFLFGQTVFESLHSLFYAAGASWQGAIALGNLVVLSAGGIAVALLARSMQGEVRRAAKVSEDHGRAAAAGASMAAAGLGTATLVGIHAMHWWSLGTFMPLLFLLRLLSTGIAVGMLGSRLFQALDSERSEPGLYRFFSGAGSPMLMALVLLGIGGVSPFGWGAGVLFLAGLWGAVQGVRAGQARRLSAASGSDPKLLDGSVKDSS